MDVVFGSLREPSNRLHEVRVSETPTPDPEVCRCGTRIPSGGIVVRVQHLPAAAEELFRDRPFCSGRCLRAFCLESLETLDGLDTPQSEAIVSDLHEFYRGVAQAFAQIL